MRSGKRYTNQTFTKRVDHEGGLHRSPRARSEPKICESCGAGYVGKRWVTPANLPVERSVFDPSTAKPTMCPACRQQKENIPGGFVYLEGPFFETHRDEVEHLLANEVERAAANNPLCRVLKWEADEDGRTVLTTSTEHLAQRLGHALEKAFNGEVRYGFSHENKLTRVWWRREA